MKKKNNPPDNVTAPLVAKYGQEVIGVLCGFDRFRLRGTLRALDQPTVLLGYRLVCQGLLKPQGAISARTTSSRGLRTFPKPSASWTDSCRSTDAAPLDRLLDRSHPYHRQICRPLDGQDYWTAWESEYATDGA